MHFPVQGFSQVQVGGLRWSWWIWCSVLLRWSEHHALDLCFCWKIPSFSFLAENPEFNLRSPDISWSPWCHVTLTTSPGSSQGKLPHNNAEPPPFYSWDIIIGQNRLQCLFPKASIFVLSDHRWLFQAVLTFNKLQMRMLVLNWQIILFFPGSSFS